VNASRWGHRGEEFFKKAGTGRAVAENEKIGITKGEGEAVGSFLHDESAGEV